jgi:hypothetical protein
MSGNAGAPGIPQDDRMRGGQPSAEDPVGEIAALAEDPDSDDDEIMRKLQNLGATLSADEVFAALVRYDTPDVLG